MSAPQSLGWIERLVAFDTTSRNPNRDLLDAVAAHLREHGIEPVLRPAPDQPGKANLLATVSAADGTRSGGVVISGHTDVVPVDDQRWSGDPFAVRRDGERLIGRGTADMKSWIAVFLNKLPALRAADLAEPVHLALSYDEEVGCLGGAQIVEDIAELGLAPRACLVGEPTSMVVVGAHKGINVVTVRFTGVAAHSSLTDQGVNAVEYAAQLIGFVRNLADGWRARGPFDEAYPVPYSTASVNRVVGGIAQNIVPAACEVTLEFRNTAEVDADEVVAAITAEAERLAALMRAESPGAGVEVDVLAQVPGLDGDPDGPARALAVAAGAENGSGKVTYGTEAGQFAGSGIDTVVVGPGDIAQAHTADEYVEVDQVLACEAFFDNLIRVLSRR